jgi:hypothetical protein
MLALRTVKSKEGDAMRCDAHDEKDVILHSSTFSMGVDLGSRITVYRSVPFHFPVSFYSFL